MSQMPEETYGISILEILAIKEMNVFIRLENYQMGEDLIIMAI